MKKCPGCCIEKDYSFFSKDKSAADGLQSRCKACVKEEYTQRYAQPGYISWVSMKQRCSPKHPNARYYYSRGIRVHPDFMTYDGFIGYMGMPPTEKHTVDRIDNDKGYEPGNVRWATATEQTRNMRSNKTITYNGETLCYSEWEERAGLPRGIIHERIKRGWTGSDAISTPPEVKDGSGTTRFISYGGETMSCADWSLRLGGNRGLVSGRIKRGWTEERAVTTPA